MHFMLYLVVQTSHTKKKKSECNTPLESKFRFHEDLEISILEILEEGKEDCEKKLAVGTVQSNSGICCLLCHLSLVHSRG